MHWLRDFIHKKCTWRVFLCVCSRNHCIIIGVYVVEIIVFLIMTGILHIGCLPCRNPLQQKDIYLPLHEVGHSMNCLHPMFLQQYYLFRITDYHDSQHSSPFIYDVIPTVIYIILARDGCAVKKIIHDMLSVFGSRPSETIQYGGAGIFCSNSCNSFMPIIVRIKT